MKTLLFITACLLFISLDLFPQVIDTAISEGQQFNYCGKIIILDGIWIDNGIMKVDLSILENERSKPITGGYKIMDKVEINDSCFLFVNDIEKQGFNTKINGGKNNTSSRVRLSNNPNLYTDTSSCFSDVMFLKGSEYFIISYKLFQWSIKETHTIDFPYAVIKERIDGKNNDVTLKQKDLMWWTTCVYELNTIKQDTLIFKKLNSYFYSENK